MDKGLIGKNALIQFVQPVANSGYAMLNGNFRQGFSPEELAGPALTSAGDAGFFHVRPSAELCLEFASLDPDDDNGILEFASRYGHLGEITWLARGGEPARMGELRSFWTEEIHQMRAAVTLWRLIRANDSQALKRVIHWKGDCVMYEGLPAVKEFATRAVIASNEYHPELLDRMKSPDVMTPARLYLQRLINEALAKWVAPRVLWESNTHLGIHITPRTLLGHMWFGFAELAAEHHSIRNCANCGRLMSVVHTGVRANRTTCGSKCRNSLFLKRKTQARRLASQGLRPAQIAEQLGGDSKTIGKWIKEGRKSSGSKAR